MTLSGRRVSSVEALLCYAHTPRDSQGLWAFVGRNGHFVCQPNTEHLAREHRTLYSFPRRWRGTPLQNAYVLHEFAVPTVPL
jgi:hypothetical protein